MLTIYTVYDRPSDHPGHYVMRKWFVTADELKPDKRAELWTDYEPLRERLESRGLVRMERRPGDDPAVMETWV